MSYVSKIVGTQSLGDLNHKMKYDVLSNASTYVAIR